MSGIIYRINNNDIITYISSLNWNKFALDNSGFISIEENVLNKNIWDFISDPETSQIYKMLLDKVRVTGQNISVPFRCDAPEYRRFFIMEIKKAKKNLIQFNSIIKKIEKRKSIKLLENEISRSNQFLKICSWCKKIEVLHENKWVEVEEAIIKLELFKLEKLPMLTHTMCPRCFEEMENLAH